MNIVVRNEFGRLMWEGDLDLLMESNEMDSWEQTMLLVLGDLGDARVILGEKDEPFFVEAA
jgi:hypothetical protein